MVIPDLGTYGANMRIQEGHIESIQTSEGAESFIQDWFKKWMNAMKSDLPQQFLLAGLGNGSYQAGLLAAMSPERILKLLLLAPARFCPTTETWDM